MSALASPASRHSPPPASLDSQKRKHGRSSSFTEFMSKILPANRKEKNHTLRNNFQDGGSHTAADLVFGLACENEDMVSATDSGGRQTDAGLEEEGKNGKGMGGGRTDRQYGSVQSMEGDSRRNSDVKAKAQQMFEDKKSRREKKRALRESGDYLGVQGVNPRTGYVDPSASSTETSQMSEETKRRLDRESKEVEEQRRRFEESRAKHRADLGEAQRSKDAKRKERVEKKKVEESMRQRRLGRWKPDGNGWSSVVEPHLSPIVQSAAVSPAKEMPPEDRLFPMPSGANPTPYVYSSKLVPQDYFGLGSMLSPPVIERPGVPEPRRSSAPPRATEYYQDLNLGQLPSRPASVLRQPTIPRKPVGSPPRRASSIETVNTIIHSQVSSFGINKSPASFHETDLVPPPSPRRVVKSEVDHFLDKKQLPPEECQRLYVGKALAISYQSALTSQIDVHRRLAPSPSSSRGSSFPPVSLKEAISARSPSSSQVKAKPQLEVQDKWLQTVPKKHLATSSPSRSSLVKARVPPIVTQWGQSSITIPTTTTTGYVLHHHIFGQLDGSNEVARKPSLQRKLGIIPSRTSSQKNIRPNPLHHNTSQVPISQLQPDNGTSLDQLLLLTDPRIKGSPPSKFLALEEGMVKKKNTHISMSMFPQKLKKAAAGKVVALLSSQGKSHTITLKKSNETITKPRATLLNDLGDIESPSIVNEEADRDPVKFVRKLTAESKAEWAEASHGDDTAVYVSPTTESMNLGKLSDSPSDTIGGGNGVLLRLDNLDSDMETCHSPGCVPRLQTHKYIRTKSESCEIIDMNGAGSQQRPRLPTPPYSVAAGGVAGNLTPELSMLELTRRVFETEVMNANSELRRSWRRERNQVQGTREDIVIFTVGLCATATAVLLGFVFAKVVEEVVLGPLRFLGRL